MVGPVSCPGVTVRCTPATTNAEHVRSGMRPTLIPLPTAGDVARRTPSTPQSTVLTLHAGKRGTWYLMTALHHSELSTADATQWMGQGVASHCMADRKTTGTQRIGRRWAVKVGPRNW
jgi:hypothetical protein